MDDKRLRDSAGGVRGAPLHGARGALWEASDARKSLRVGRTAGAISVNVQSAADEGAAGERGLLRVVQRNADILCARGVGLGARGGGHIRAKEALERGHSLGGGGEGGRVGGADDAPLDNFIRASSARALQHNSSVLREALLGERERRGSGRRLQKA